MKKYIHGYKCLKVVELVALFILESSFLIVLISNKALRSSIFVDKSLFILCAILYFTVLISYAYLLVDFIKLKELKRLDHELENIAYIDSKSGIPNRTSCDIFFDTYKSADSMNGLGVVITEIANLRDINAANGKEFGDRSIVEFSQVLEKASANFGFIGRNGGNEFITVIEKCDEARIKEYFDSLQKNISRYNSSIEKGQLELHSEYVLFDSEDNVSTFSDLLSKAYNKLKANK